MRLRTTTLLDTSNCTVLTDDGINKFLHQLVLDWYKQESSSRWSDHG
ncbi:hypothetical protein [Photobacterium iliopiscarium]|nr:hypothetical protein [Photobacterium iliopiscarium]MCD9487703.1 hypothetical protein [Photobacterium iliopiscarium]MCF2244395.1 hypothetical protein [Photobacterium iliopiscarium]